MSARRLTLLLAGLLLGVSQVYQGSAGSIEIAVGSREGTPGSSLTVPVSVSVDPDVVALQFDLIYDAQRLDTGAVRLQTSLPAHQLLTSEPVSGVTRVIVFSRTNQVIPTSVNFSLDVAIAENQLATVVPLTPRQVITGNISAVTGGGRQIRAGEVIVRENAPARIGQPVFSPTGAFSLALEGLVGRTITIQASTDFETWTDIDTFVVESENQRFEDDAAAAFPIRFYRAIVVD